MMVQEALKKYLPVRVVNYLRRFKNLFRSLKANNFSEQVRHFAQVEKEVLLLPKLINLDGTSLDVGANVGTFSFYLAKASPEGKVFCFEPRNDLFSKLKKNLNSFNNCTLINKAVSNANLDLEITLDPSDGNSTVVKQLNSAGIRKQKTTAISIDNFCKDFKLDSVDFIKIDVEGFEFNVIDGAKDTLLGLRPILLCESVNKQLKPQGLDVQMFMDKVCSEFKYKVFYLDEGQLKLANPSLIKDHKVKGERYIYNWIFLPSEKLEIFHHLISV